MTEIESLTARNARIAEVFLCIKGLAEEYLDRPYPDAPDPDQYIDMIADAVVKYDKLKEDE